MPITILDPGLHSLPVDFGRPSARALGVPLGGAADRRAFRLCNLLLGNGPTAVAVEVALKGPTLRADVDTVAVVFGAPFEVTVDGRAVSPNTTFRLTPGNTLRIGGTPTACRAYLGVAGGFEVADVLGSRSALEPLKPGDVLNCEWGAGRVGRGLSIPSGNRGPTTLRVLPGPQSDWFPAGDFFDRTFTVAPASNRMGVRLLGEPIAKRPGELASEPVAPGAVQVTNDGLPVVLGVDGQTVGGYPKVAHVIRADLDLLGQLRPGDGVRFASVSVDEADAAADDRAREFRLWRTRLSVG
jgi:antagonist of KipI